MATNWTDGSGNGDWYTAGNWSNGAPANTANGTLQVTISGAIGTQPTISPLEAGATNIIGTVSQNGTNYEESQIAGQTISLTNHADLVLQGAVLGLYRNDAIGKNITNLTAAPNSTVPTFDSHMVITAIGSDTLSVNDVNHNFGLLEATGAGNDLQITISVGGNSQNPHGLINYGEILANAGATVNVNVLNPTAGDTTDFANAGYIVITGATFATNTGIADGANVQNAAGIPDGYIEIGSVGSALLLGTVAAKEEVVFLDGSHNMLEIANGNLFQGNVAGFQAGDTIAIQGVSQDVSLSYSGSILSVAQINSAGTVTATSTINIGTSYTASQFVDVFNTTGVNIITGNTSLSSTSGSIFIDNGHSYTLTNTTGVDTIPVTFGTHGSALAPNILDLNGTVAGTNSPYQGTITGFGANDIIVLGPSILPTAAGSSVTESFNPATGLLTVTEISATGTTLGTSTVTLAGDGSLTSGSFIAVQGSNGVQIELANNQLTSNSGSIFIDYGHSVTLSNTAIDTVPVTFGTHGSLTGLNTLDINGTVTGTNSPYQGAISGFGLNDDIIIGQSVLPSLASSSEVTLSYAGSLLTVGEVNATGTVTASTTINVGTGYSTSSFVALLGTNGINIVTAAEAAATSFTLQATSTVTPTANFEDPTQYAGHLAPGSTIIAGETVTILPTSLAQITSSLSNNGVILLNGASANAITSAPVTGTGTFSLVGGAELVVGNTLGVTTNTIAFGADTIATPNILDLTGTSAGFTGNITGFGTADQIILSGSVLPVNAGANSFSNSYNTATGILTVTETNPTGTVVGSKALSIANTGSLTSASFAELNGPGGTTIILGTAVSSTLVDAIFQPVTSAAGTIVGGETVSGVLNSVYNTTGTLISETGTMVLTETLTTGGVVTETFAVNGTGTITNNGTSNNFGAGINPNDNSNGQYEVFLTSIASTGTGPIFTDLHLDWNSEANQDLYLGVQNSYFNALTGPSVTTEMLLSVGAMTTSGSIFIDNGNIVTLSGLTTIDTTPVVFGTHNSSLAFNVLDINSTIGGTNSPYQGAISGFGLNDDIILGPSVLPSVATGSAATLTYAGSLLTVGEVNATGTVTASTTLNVGTGYSTSSFVALLGTNGINIETPATVAETPLTFSAAGTTANFETPSDYVGGLAPGSSIVSGETVIVAAGTASISSTSPVSNSGTIIVSGTGSALIDAATLAGGGTIAIQNGAAVTLANTIGTDASQTIQFSTGATSLALNTLDLTGSTLGFAGTIAGFGVNDAIVLAGGVLPTVAIGSSVALSYAGSLLTVAELNNAGAVTASTTLNVGTGFTTASFVDLIGTNGVTIETAATAGEKPLTFSAAGTTTNFETPGAYAGGLAPGNTIVAGETVLVAAGTASITSTSPVSNSGTIIISGTASALVDAATLAGGGTIAVANGGQVTLANATGTDAAQTILLGTGGTSLALNTVDLNGSTLGFAGTIAGFGLNDDIIIGPSVLPSLATGSAVSLSYAGSLLTVGEVNAAGAVTASTTINVGTGYSTSSFVALLGTNGINIETPATVDEKPLTFTGTAGTVSSFEDPTKYAGSLAPGSSIVAGETVIIAAGTASIASTSPVANSGTIIIAGTSSALIDTATLSGAGTLAISTGGHVTLANTTGVDTGTVYFGTGGTATNPNLLDLTGTGTLSFGGTIANFGTFDTIVIGTSVLPGTETSFSTLVSGGLETLTVTSSVNGTIHTDQITFASAPPGVFVVTNSPNGILVADLPCFAAGTRILTGTGQVAVESLKAGDKVLSARTGKLAEVVWVGSRSIDLARHAMPEKVRPIRIIAGAFADALPERDLIVSPDHALFIDGHLIEAKTLVNGVTIIQDKAIRFITYHHVELAAHDIMLAEGLAAESFLDSGNRAMFESDAAPMMLHPDFAAAARSKACAKLLTDGDIVITARARLLLRAIELGFNTTDAVEVTAIAAGHTIQPSINGRELVFVLPAGATSVELLSAAGVPAETTPAPGDRRVLGLAISGLALVTGGQRIAIALDNPAHTGFHAMETSHRWTNGAARIALPAYTGRAVLEVTINGQAKRWISAA